MGKRRRKKEIKAARPPATKPSSDSISALNYSSMRQVGGSIHNSRRGCSRVVCIEHRKVEVKITAENNDDLEAFAQAWHELQSRTPVKLHPVENEHHYRAMVNLINKLIEQIGDRESHYLMDLLDIATLFVRDYEERNIEIPEAEPRAVLRFLMEQHDLRQSDLAGPFGSQSNVSEVLNGNREINARLAQALGSLFGVSPAAFIWHLTLKKTESP